MNNKGFTLVELIGSMVILGILMLVVVPNVVGLMNSNREAVYVEDAKKMVNIAKSKVSMHKVEMLSDNACLFLGLGYLDNSEFDNPPNGGCYDVNRSFVVVKKNGSTKEYEYYVRLVEYHEKRYNGIVDPVLSTNLNKDIVKQDVTNNSIYTTNFFDYKTNTTTISVAGCTSYDKILNHNGPKTYTDDSEGMCAK